MIKELLQIIPIKEAKIEIDGRSGKEYMKKTATYLRHEINKGNDKKLTIKFEDSINDNLIQLADLIAGSINRSLSPEKTDKNKYLKIIKNKVVIIKKLN